ncbi:hypothetical protein SLS57_001618 [Botryosphaeria dothidea]
MRIPTTAAAAAALLSALLPLANAANLTFIVPPHPALLPAGASVLPASTHATLHSAGPALSAPLRRDGSFVFTDVPAGSYLLSVHARDHAFENLRVDVDADEKARAWQTFRGNEWSNKGEKRGEAGRDEGKLVAEVRAVAKKEYYQERGGFNVMSFLKNPMILMGVFSLALIVGMPYLMDNMDEETRAEFEEMQKKSPLSQNPANQLQNFDLASFLAGKTNDQPQQQQEKSGGSGAKRRG